MSLSKSDRVKKQLKALRQRQVKDKERAEELEMIVNHIDSDSDDELELEALSADEQQEELPQF